MKFDNGVAVIKPFVGRNPTKFDWLLAMLDWAGVKVSSMPRGYSEKCKSYSESWEVFDPTQVEDVDSLPEIWKKVYRIHNEPSRRDCVNLAYRYVHTPVDILPQYPRVPCKGIFVITDKELDLEKLTADDLIHIGNEIDEEE